MFFFCQDFFWNFLRIFWSLFLKNCWYFVFATLFWRVPYYNTKSFCFCQGFFKTFFKVFSEVWQALILCCIHSLDCFENVLIHRLSGLSFSLSRRVLIYNTTQNWFCQHLFWKNLNFFLRHNRTANFPSHNSALRITHYELFKWEHSVGENHWQQVLPLSNLIVCESILVPPFRCVEHLQVAAISLRDIAVLCSNHSFLFRWG